MFEVALALMTDFVPFIVPMVCIILLFNIISNLLWGSK